jgi:hypothetical protein
MSVVINEVRGTVEPEAERGERESNLRQPATSAEAPREIQEETLRWNLEHIKQRMLRLCAD